MTYLAVKTPYELFFDTDGTPLESGYIYIGLPNLNPILNPLPLFWDKNGLYPAAQPIRTIAGYPDRNGSPSLIYIDLTSYDDYSILINDKNGVLVYSSISYLSENDAGSATSVDLINDLRSIQFGFKPVYVRGHTSIGDGGQGDFEWIDGAAPGTYTDNNGTTILPTGGDGSGAWIRQFVGDFHVKWFGVRGDGVTDDTANFQLALDQIGGDTGSPSLGSILDEAAPGLFIDVPDEYYLITDELEFRNSSFIHGSGQSSVVRFAPSTPGLSLFKSGSINHVVTFRDFSIMGPAATADEVSNIGNIDCNGLYLDDISFGLVDNMYVSNFSDGIGIFIVGASFRCHFYNNHIHDCATGYKFGANTGATANAHTIRGGSIRSCGRSSTAVTSGTDADKYDFLQEHAAVFIGSGKHIEITGITFEGNFHTCFLMQQARNIKITSCWMELNCKLLDKSQADAVADANDTSLMNIYLWAASANSVWVVGTNISIDNVIIENCRDEYAPRLHASDSRWIHSFYYKNNYLSARSPGITVVDGYSFDLFLEGCTRRDSGIQSINPPSNNRPDIRSVTTTGTYPDDPFLIGRYGERIATGYRVTQSPTLAGTNDLIIDSSTGFHENECIINVPTTYGQNDVFNEIKYRTNGYIPAGYTVTLQFADGTHTWTSGISLEEFSGGGKIRFMGNQSEADALHTNQAVIINGSTINDAPHIKLVNSNISIEVEKIQFQTADDNNSAAIETDSVQGLVHMNACYIISTTGTRDGRGFYVKYTQNAWIENTYVSNLGNAIFAYQTSTIFSDNNDDTGTTPQYGLRAEASVIMKNGTQPAGNTANEISTKGGVIR